MLVGSSDMFYIESHVQHGHSHDDGVNETQKFLAAWNMDILILTF